MDYKSIFDFLKDDDRFNSVYDKCIEVEKSIIQNSSNAIFILGRSISEELIKLIIKDNKKLSKRFFKKKSDGSYKDYSLESMINSCKTEKLISNSIQKKYHKIRKWGNATVHGKETGDFINEFEKEHKMLFDISLHCYNYFNIRKDIMYQYYLDDYDFKIETSARQRENQINNVHFNDVSQENLIESFESKQIFIPKKYFKSIIDSYKGYIIDKNKFKNDIKEYDYIDDDNVNIILDYFDVVVKEDINRDIQKLHEELSKDTLKTLNSLDENELTIDELNTLIKNAENENQKRIYSYIKSLADDLLKTHIEEYKKELETSPITQLSENGRKLLSYKNYKIVEDDFGFSLEEVEDNIFLDDDQKEAVEYDGKALVVDAGPGSGKTRVIIERVVHLVESGKKPETILVITFTRKATQELRERLINETDLDINDINLIRISTVHGFCRYILNKYEPVPFNYLTRHGETSLFFKKYKQQLGFTRYSFIYDQWIPSVLDIYGEYFSFQVDTEGLVNYINQKMEPFKNGNNRKYEYFIDNFYRDHNLNENPDWNLVKLRGYTGPNYHYTWLNIAKSYPEFLKLMDDTSTCDDNTVLDKANKILENDFILENIQYKNILVDEFQDTDFHQNNIFEKLYKICDTFTIVGDIDQSIYCWRGAYPKFFKDFMLKNPKKVTLHTNYRSSRNIVEFNEELIRPIRDGKKLKSKKKYRAPIYHLSNLNSEDEATHIANIVERLMIDNKIKYYSDVAILFRRNKSLERIMKEFDAKGIDYYLKENNDFLNQVEVKAMLLLFWYLMPYEKTVLPHLSEDLLNLSVLGSDLFDEIFRLSIQTKFVLKSIQENYESDILKSAKNILEIKQRSDDDLSYITAYNLEDSIKKEVFNGVNSFDIGLLNKAGLIKLGIDESDVDFFLKLNDIKLRMYSENSNEKLTTLKIFYELLNLTDYFSEISIENNPDDLKVKDNLALFSHIIQDYESIMGDTDYMGLFAYLSRVLTKYSCRYTEADEGFNKVHLLSVHSAKGLEYPVVILGSIKQGICPLNYNSDKGYYQTPDEFLELKDDNPEIEKQKFLDEELRIIYVASTRAKEVLILSSIGKNPDDVPDFLSLLKHNPNVKIELLEDYNISIIPKIEASKVFKLKNDFPKVNFENFVDDFLYCDYRYDLANNTRFKVRLRNDKYVNMVLHKLLNNIYDDEIKTISDIDRKIETIVKYHNISTSNNAFKIIQNVSNYWNEWGKDYEVVDSNINILTRLKYCDLTSTIDLLIKDEDKLSIVHFIGSDSNIPNIDLYKTFLLFYVHVLKQFDEYKDKEFNKIYVHSLENNKRYEVNYDENSKNQVLEYLDISTEQIHENIFKKVDNCSTCEYYGNVCTGYK